MQEIWKLVFIDVTSTLILWNILVQILSFNLYSLSQRVYYPHFFETEKSEAVSILSWDHIASKW